MNLCIVCGLPIGRKKNCPRCKELKEKSIDGECSYCRSIYESTSKSPKKRFIYCPMCSKEVDKSKMKKWVFNYEN